MKVQAEGASVSAACDDDGRKQAPDRPGILDGEFLDTRKQHLIDPALLAEVLETVFIQPSHEWQEQ